MPFDRGTFSFTLFSLRDNLPENAGDVLGTRKACKLDEVTGEPSFGWVTGQHLLDTEIDEIEAEIKFIMDALDSPILTIPGISYRMGAMILAEIGDFSRFDSPDKILAYAGMSPSTYQSGQLNNCHAHMEKRGSRYLRYALFNAAKFVCHWDPTFSAYLAKKRAEGKHYTVAVSHAAKKLIRVIYQLEKSGQPYRKVS